VICTLPTVSNLARLIPLYLSFEKAMPYLFIFEEIPVLSQACYEACISWAEATAALAAAERNAAA
jgi:hypothetical protein